MFIDSTEIDIDLCKEKIQNFNRDCKILIDDFGLSAINKLHECFCHLLPWLEHFQVGLRCASEHTGEHIHSDLFEFCAQKQILNKAHPGYLDCLKKLVVAYVSSHRKSELCI